MLLLLTTSTFAGAQLIMDRSDMISDLIDFILGNKSPRAAYEIEKRPAMGGVVQAPFHPLYTLISYLVRLTYTSQMDLDQRLDSHYKIQQNDLKNSTVKTYFLTEEAQIMLTKTEFLEKVIFDTKYETVEQFSNALSHLCYRNIKFSRKVSKKLLKAVSYSSNDQVVRHLGILLKIAQIQDEFQVHRLEFLFGFGCIMLVRREDNPLAQYGADVMRNTISHEVYTICTPIDARIFDDSLLNLLWKYKGRMDSFTITCLESLGNLVLNDDLILNFFADIPAPNYNLGRYTDWILPYLTKQRDDALKYSAGSGTQEKLQTIATVNELFEAYEQRVIQAKGDEKFYIVTEVLSEEIVSQNVFDEAIELTIIKIAAKFIESVPTGSGNMSIDFSKKDTNEEQKMQSNAIAGNFQSSSLGKANEEEAKDLLQSSFELKEMTSRDLLYRIHARNLLQSNVQIKIDFVPTDASESIDLVYPRGGIKDFLKPDGDFPVFTLRRRNPFAAEEDADNEMLKLNLSLKWKTYGADDFTVSNFATSLSKPEAKTTQTSTQSQPTQRRNGINLGVDTSIQTPKPEEPQIIQTSSEPSGMKACPFCTYDNLPSATQCMICEGML